MSHPRRLRMKVIFSRKGFDSAAGGVPSPILPDGRLLSLPIPDKASEITYADIAAPGYFSIGDFVEQLAGIPRTHRAHLDPDLCASSLSRAEGWRPIFGQVGTAQRHLDNQGVGAGDVFLFFGVFRDVERAASGWQYVRGSRPVHVLFGWLQVAQRVAISEWPVTECAWALYHPHFARESDPTNVVYTAAERLTLPKQDGLGIAGAGVFDLFSPGLRLTAPESVRAGLWLLPEWFHPNGRGSTLTYHGDLCRWRKCSRGVELATVSRGQEFVLDCDDYPEAIEWLLGVLRLGQPR